MFFIEFFPMKLVLFFILFYLACIATVGLLTLDVNISRSSTILIALILSLLTGIFFRRYFKAINLTRLYFLSGGAFIFYAISGLVFSWDHLFTGPMACLIAYSLGFWAFRIKHWPAWSPLFLGLFVFYAFFWYPYKGFISPSLTRSNDSQSVFADSNIRLENIAGQNQLDSLKNKVILFETWNEHCGACFAAMRDLHPFFKHKEQEYEGFVHVYLYSQGKRNKKEANNPQIIFSNKRFPYDDMKILLDRDGNLYREKLAGGFPHFLLIDRNGKTIYRFNGYQSNYQHAYQRFFSNSLKDIFKKS